MKIRDFPPLDLGQMKNPPSYEELQALCARAADALDGYRLKPFDQYRRLIDELRKAAGVSGEYLGEK